MSEIDQTLQIMEQLRDPDNGCPWDIKQTHSSIAKCAIEESYELISSIIKNDPKGIKEELGDLLLQVIFHSQIANEEGNFNFNDVVKELNNKLVRRHPHVFDEKIKKKKITAAEQERVWESIKRSEKNTDETDVFSHLNDSLPPSKKAIVIQNIARTFNFDWESKDQVICKIKEEIDELEESFEHKDKTLEEFGDILFSVINLSRHLDIDPEIAIEYANKKFIDRFTKLKDLLAKKSIDMKNANIEQLNDAWEEVKKSEVNL